MRGRQALAAIPYARFLDVRVLAWQDDPAKPVAAGIGNFLL